MSLRPLHASLGLSTALLGLGLSKLGVAFRYLGRNEDGRRVLSPGRIRGLGRVDRRRIRQRTQRFSGRGPPVPRHPQPRDDLLVFDAHESQMLVHDLGGDVVAASRYDGAPLSGTLQDC